jgi:hypothetical protein
MIDFILGWVLGRNITNDTVEEPIERFETYTPKRRREITVYEYWPAFDNDIPSLETAYKLYEENHTCHVIQGGTCKCFYEFDGDDGYVENDPEHFFENI